MKRYALCCKKVRKITRKKQSVFRTVALLITNFLYWGILFVLTGVTISVVFQQIANPEKIPHVFGYKIFIILDDYMTDELQKGDLIVTKNIPAQEYQQLDSMAFRNGADVVTIHQILQINEVDGKRFFGMKALPNETQDLKYVAESSMEGKLVKTIPYVGLILLYIQMPQVMGGILLAILLCGGVALWIARKLDDRDLAKIKRQQAVEIY